MRIRYGRGSVCTIAVSEEGSVGTPTATQVQASTGVSEEIGCAGTLLVKLELLSSVAVRKRSVRPRDGGIPVSAKVKDNLVLWMLAR